MARRSLAPESPSRRRIAIPPQPLQIVLQDVDENQSLVGREKLASEEPFFVSSGNFVEPARRYWRDVSARVAARSVTSSGREVGERTADNCRDTTGTNAPDPDRQRRPRAKRLSSRSAQSSRQCPGRCPPFRRRRLNSDSAGYSAGRNSSWHRSRTLRVARSAAKLGRDVVIE